MTELYVQAEENLKARQEFADSKLGIFIHWGIYSMFAQGEWYMTNANIDNKEYAKAASAFYPVNFDAKAWVSAIKAAGYSEELSWYDRLHFDSYVSIFNGLDVGVQASWGF